MATAEHDHRELARRAIVEICARGDYAKAPQFYSERFHDHVNSLEYHGLEGVRQSVELYRSIFPDLEIKVDDQDGRRRSRRLPLDRPRHQPRPASHAQGHHDQPLRAWQDRRGLGLLRYVGDACGRGFNSESALAAHFADVHQR